jgi:hypothetical protein
MAFNYYSLEKLRSTNKDYLCRRFLRVRKRCKGSIGFYLL